VLIQALDESDVRGSADGSGKVTWDQYEGDTMHAGKCDSVHCRGLLLHPPGTSLHRTLYSSNVLESAPRSSSAG
jgi:hypothetical protein